MYMDMNLGVDMCMFLDMYMYIHVMYVAVCIHLHGHVVVHFCTNRFKSLCMYVCWGVQTYCVQDVHIYICM